MGSADVPRPLALPIHPNPVHLDLQSFLQCLGVSRIFGGARASHHNPPRLHNSFDHKCTWQNFEMAEHLNSCPKLPLIKFEYWVHNPTRNNLLKCGNSYNIHNFTIFHVTMILEHQRYLPYLVTLLLHLIQSLSYYYHFKFLTRAWLKVSKPTDRHFTSIRLPFLPFSLRILVPRKS